MNGSAATPEGVDPYATLETILKIIGRSWLTEEWRLEDIRLLAQTAITKRDTTTVRKPIKLGSRHSRRSSQAKRSGQTAAEQFLSS